MNAAIAPPPLSADIPVREDWVDVPGARLKYRLSGKPGKLPLMVFENGWGASHYYWAWIERVLAPQTQLLFYDRAGIGGSRKTAPLTVEALSAQFAAMLDALGQHEPVLVVGHSYGGLMGSLHAAQQPQRLRALVQLDPTPDSNDPRIDHQLGWTRQIGKLARLCARLGIPDPVFSPAGRELPQPEARLLVETSFSSVSSLTAGLEEFALLSAIRARIARATVQVPRLTISADAATEMTGLARILVSPAKARELLDYVQALHRGQVERNRGIWEKLPYTHGGMVFTPAGGIAGAQRVLSYAQSLASAPA